MSEVVTITPAQIDFLSRSLPGFHLPDNIAELAGRAGSQRYFVRISHNKKTYIMVVWDSRDEDWSRFLGIGRDTHEYLDLLPEIIADDQRHGLILEEDLGSMTLKRFCSDKTVDKKKAMHACTQTLDALIVWQAPHIGSNPIIAARSMDLDTFIWETSYFARYCVTDFCGCEAILDNGWEQERMELARICSSLPQTAIHRDFQSENVMLHNGRVRFVDFQGARLGPPEYDVASLLFDPYNDLMDESACNDLYSYYCNAGKDRNHHDRLCLCAAQRLMQALGAYGNLSLHRGKAWYREYIPVALSRLSDVVCRLDGFAAIRRVVEQCARAVNCANH